MSNPTDSYCRDVLGITDRQALAILALARCERDDHLIKTACVARVKWIGFLWWRRRVAIVHRWDWQGRPVASVVIEIPRPPAASL